MGDVVAAQRVQGCRQTLIVSVVPDVTGIDKTFDYLVPENLVQDIAIGIRVRVPLHHRKVHGWVVAIAGSPSSIDPSRLLQIISISGVGPSEEIISLGEWATDRWAGRLRAFCVAGSPSAATVKVPNARYSSIRAGISHDTEDVQWAIAAKQLVVLKRGPQTELASLVAQFASAGPTLVVVPTLFRARMIAASLRRSGFGVALMGDDWAAAAGGVDVIIGSRGAVWASAPRLASIIVIDEHDDGLQEERSPTWHARDVAIERARRLNISCIAITPTPSVAILAACGDRLRETPEPRLSTWPEIRVVDRTQDEAWSSSLLSSELIAELRDHTRRIVCVINTKGRARLLACATCRAIARCEKCDAAVALLDTGVLRCPRCETQRPQVCSQCKASKFALLKPGVSRLREELAAAAGRSVAEVVEISGAAKPGESSHAASMLIIGTEAVLHRIHEADTVVLLDLDAELFAPRYRATEITLGLVVLACRVAASRKEGGRVILQTHSAEHQLFVALRTLNFDDLMAQESSRRASLQLPPFGALAHISGVGTTKFAEELSSNMLVSVATLASDDVLVRGATVKDLVESLRSAKKPKGSRLKVQVDPPRI